MGEVTLCMTSSLTTGLKGPRLASHRTPVPPDFYRHSAAISPIKAEGN